MKEVFSKYLNSAFWQGLVLTLLSTLFLFTSLTTEFFDLPKFLVLLIFVAIMLILLTTKFSIENRVNFIRTPFDIPLLLLLAVAVVSTVLSPSPYVSLLGQNLKIHGSLISLVVYVLFYFVLTQNLKSQREVRLILNLCIWAAALLSVFTLLIFFGMKLPIPFAFGSNFTPTGASFSTTSILAILLPILVSQILGMRNLVFLTIYSIFLTLFGLTLALTGTWASWIAAILGVSLTFLVLNPLKEVNLQNISNIVSQKHLFFPASSLIIILLITALSFIPSFGVPNPLYSIARNFPRELQLNVIHSWKISVSAFRDSPFWGSGPGTFLFNFTTYKPIEFNSTKFWNIRFDSAFNEYLQILANLGGVGLLAFVSLTVLFASGAIPALRSKLPLNPELSISGIVFFVILLLHSSTLPLMVFGLLILACFWILNQGKAGFSLLNMSVLHKIAPMSSSSEQTFKVEALPSILLVASIVIVLFTLFFGGKFTISDLHHKNALNAVSKNNGVLAYNELIAAEKLNPYNDLYRTDLAQLNFALANAIAVSKAPTETSPEGSLTEQDKQNIQTLLQQSINEARTATGLSPRSAVNWEILALLYRQIAGVAQNALLFSLDSYGRAIFNDPLNPSLRLNVGGVYYAVKNYDLAIRFFTDSINLKPDYANGFYNLSVALRDKGDLNGALQAAEKTLALVDPSSSDYKIASDYLNDLKTKTEGPPAQPPAATASGELQKEELPKVLDLPKPEKIATPEAIKKPSPSPTPKP